MIKKPSEKIHPLQSQIVYEITTKLLTNESKNRNRIAYKQSFFGITKFDQEKKICSSLLI